MLIILLPALLGMAPESGMVSCSSGERKNFSSWYTTQLSMRRGRTFELAGAKVVQGVETAPGR